MVYSPVDYDPENKKYPILYLLHGHSSHYAGWTYLQDQLLEWCDLNQIILVCPDGDFDSWYIDSPVQKHRKYETFLVKELSSYIDSLYASISSKYFRGISGVSMGGHGAIYLSLKYPDHFGCCGSISGALNLMTFPNEWNLASLLGPLEQNPSVWESISCLQLLDKSLANCFPMRIDIGKDDFFLEANRQFHKRLSEMNCPHEYYESEGSHSIDYWTRVLPLHLQFFVDLWKKGMDTSAVNSIKK